jgi:hypothetical protein
MLRFRIFWQPPRLTGASRPQDALDRPEVQAAMAVRLGG